MFKSNILLLVFSSIVLSVHAANFYIVAKYSNDKCEGVDRTSNSQGIYAEDVCYSSFPNSFKIIGGMKQNYADYFCELPTEKVLFECKQDSSGNYYEKLRKMNFPPTEEELVQVTFFERPSDVDVMETCMYYRGYAVETQTLLKDACINYDKFNNGALSTKFVEGEQVLYKQKACVEELSRIPFNFCTANVLKFDEGKLTYDTLIEEFYNFTEVTPGPTSSPTEDIDSSSTNVAFHCMPLLLLGYILFNM